MGTLCSSAGFGGAASLPVLAYADVHSCMRLRFTFVHKQGCVFIASYLYVTTCRVRVQQRYRATSDGQETVAVTTTTVPAFFHTDENHPLHVKSLASMRPTYIRSSGSSPGQLLQLVLFPAARPPGPDQKMARANAYVDELVRNPWPPDHI